MGKFKIVGTRQHSVYCECLPEAETDERVVKAIPHPALQLIIDRVALKRPRWHFILRGFGESDTSLDGYTRRSMYVAEDGERLGEVGFEKHWRTDGITYEIDNPRIRSVRQRGGGAKTTKPTEAVKAIINNFAAKTINELLRDADNSINLATNNAYNTALNASYYAMSSIRDEVFTAITSSPNLMQQITLPNEISDRKFKTLPDLFAKQKVVETLNDEYKRRTGSLVMLREGVLWVCPANDLTNYATHTYETAPKHILLAVAMLKIAGDGEVIEGIGTRASAQHFYVVNPQVQDE